LGMPGGAYQKWSSACPDFYPNLHDLICYHLCNGIYEMKHPSIVFHCVWWPASKQHIWCPDTNVWWLQLPSSRYHHPISSWEYAEWYLRESRWSHWELAANHTWLLIAKTNFLRFESTLRRRCVRQ
jgi:hypothetical protein